MRFILLIFLCSAFVECIAQPTNWEPDSNLLKAIDSIYQPSVDISVERVIKRYSDSINNAYKQSDLPYYLKNCDFDLIHVSVSKHSSFHSPVSLMKLIFDHVTNVEALKLIISDEKTYHVHCENPDYVLFNYLSVYELALLRYSCLVE